MAQRDSNGRFIKGNKARTLAKQNKVKTKQVLNKTEMLQQEIYNETLEQILDKLRNGELGARELISLNSSVADFVTPKAKVGRPKKKDVNENVSNLLNYLKNE